MEAHDGIFLGMLYLAWTSCRVRGLDQSIPGVEPYADMPANKVEIKT